MRDPLSQGLKLAVTLRHLASGDSYPTLQFAFRLARSTINKFVPELCDAIIRAYRDEVMITSPTGPEGFLEVESVFRRRWNILHALEALDGKHIPIRCPRRGGCLYYNYKGFHLIVLLALVDGDYKFLWVDLGASGSSSDPQIFKHSDLRHKIQDLTIGFPESESFVDDGPKVNYFILGDNARGRCTFSLLDAEPAAALAWESDLWSSEITFSFKMVHDVVHQEVKIVSGPFLPLYQLWCPQDRLHVSDLPESVHWLWNQFWQASFSKLLGPRWQSGPPPPQLPAGSAESLEHKSTHHLWTQCGDLCGHPLHLLTTSPLDSFHWWQFTEIFIKLPILKKK